MVVLTDQAAVLGDPAGAARRTATLPNVSVTRVLDHRLGVEFDFTFEPPRELAHHGYAAEHGRVLVGRRAGADPLSWPRGPRRRWLHRNPAPGDLDEHRSTGSLCLWYPGDPEPLRWSWEHGFEAFVVRVHRHLFCEEFWRREGRWPAEDAPHGHPEHGVHPIKTEQMRRVVEEWTRSRTG